MSKKRKSTSKESQPEMAESKTDFFGQDSLSIWIKSGLAVFVLWLCCLIVFNNFIFKDNHFNLSADNMSAAAIARMGEDFQREAAVPNWCPYIFGGMPMVGSLLYVNHYYWAFYPPFKAFLSFLFFGSDFGWLFIHFIMAGFGVFWLLQDRKVNWAIALLCGILFAYNHTMVVFADVGHGSKVMTIAYLPWLLYFTLRLFENPRLLWAALLAFAFGWQLRAQHVQIAYYGVMMMGLYVIYAYIAGGKVSLRKNLKATLFLVGAGLVGLAFAAPVYLQVLEYNPYIIRGGGGTGSAAWDYATQWSFHPLESLTYIFPSFFGFGRETYWGYMPFTDMPLYWGGLVLLFAPWAVILKRDRLTWFLVVLAAAAWIVSFGGFLPILYWPLYKFLPYFDKFRVPSLIQVLVLLPTVLLAGRGLQGIFERIGKADEGTLALGRKILKAGVIIAAGCVALLILQAALRQSWTEWILSRQPRLQVQGAQAALGLLTIDLLRLMLLGGATFGAAYLILNKKYSYLMLAVPVVLYLVLETYSFDKKLLRPATANRTVENYLAADDVVGFLQQDETPFRIHNLTGGRHPNWYMPHHLESIHGYSATKMKIYQETVDSLGLGNPNLLKLMNVRYFLSDRPINHPDLEEVFAGQRERVYRYKQESPRAFLVNRAIQLGSASEIFSLYRQGTFDFTQTAVLEEPLATPLDDSATGSVSWVSRASDRMVLDVETDGRQLLFLSEVYYPSGWRATIDGVETAIHKCNYLFRGIEIPAGTHRVELMFAPASLSFGKWLSWIAFFVILAGIASAYLKLKRFTVAHSEA